MGLEKDRDSMRRFILEAQIYQGFDRGTGRAVALKVLSARSELDDHRPGTPDE